MTANTLPQKSQNILYAEWALWVWTAWTCLFGAYQSWQQIPEIEKQITDQLQGMVTASPQMLLEWIIAGYAGLAATSAWVVLKIGAGKNWARTSLLLGFILEIVWTALFPPEGLADFLENIPDFGLQICALYLLYTKPGSLWFNSSK